MPFSIPTFAEIRDKYLRDVANQLPDAYTGADSDWAVRANATASVVSGLYAYASYLSQQFLPDTSSAEWLDRHASLYLTTGRQPAVAAVGSATFSGTVGAAVPSGTQLRTAAGLLFATTASGTIGGGGTVAIAVAAVTPGAAGNVASTTACTLVSPPAQIASTATLTSAAGGADVESDDALRARVLQRLRDTPHGGAWFDYRAWVLDGGFGVSQCWVYGERRGAGTVDVVIADPTGAASATLLANIKNFLKDGYHAPVTADSGLDVIYPTNVSVAVTASLTLASGYLLATVSAQIGASLATYFAGLAPGDTVRKNKLAAIISDTPGVIDYTLSAPSANVTTTVDSTHMERGKLGTVTIT